MAGGAGGQVAGARRVRRGRAAAAQHGLVERGEPFGVGPAHRPGVAQPGHVHVVHPAGPHLGGEGLGGVGPAGRAQLRPLVGGGGPRGHGRDPGGAGGSGGAACGEQGAPAAEAGERPEHPEGDEAVDDVDDALALVDLAAEDGGDEDQYRADDRHGVLPDQELGEARRGGRGQGEEGPTASGDVPAEEFGPVPQAQAAVDQEAEEHGLVDRERVAALDRPGTPEGARVPPLARGEELHRHQPVGDVAVAPQRPQEQCAQDGDQRPDQQGAVGHAFGLLGRARGVAVPPDAGVAGRARGAQPLGERGPGPGGRGVAGGRWGVRGRRVRRWRGGWWARRAGHPFRVGAPCVVRAFGVHEPPPPDQPGPAFCTGQSSARTRGVQQCGRMGAVPGAPPPVRPSVRGGQRRARTTPRRSMTPGGRRP